MTVCVFTGPTLSPPDARSVLEAIYLPPVQQGDVYRAAVRHRPHAIGLIDGYFREVPSVWHKEILWAMAQGIHVFGSASMGALRAAELTTFGMRGVGRVFEAYRDALLPPYDAEPFEDDDEVAVLHGPSETGFATVSEALVNIRCTLAAAAEAGVIAPATRDALVRIGKALFYPDRSYQRLLSRGAEDALSVTELDALRAWLPAGRLNQKRDDAVAMLVTMREFLASDPGPRRVDYVFEPSEMWGRAAASALTDGSGPADESSGFPWDALLDELRLDGSTYPAVRRAALLRMAAHRECERQRLAPDEEARRRASAALRERLGMLDRAASERWLADNDLTPATFARLIDDEARLRQLDALTGSRVDAYLIDELRAIGAYARYAERARAKQRLLARTGLDRSSLDEWTRFQLSTWYFERHVQGSIPDDIAAYATQLGFGDIDAFYRALLREYAYVAGGGFSGPARLPGPDASGGKG
jgi:hypothetical protein